MDFIPSVYLGKKSLKKNFYEDVKIIRIMSTDRWHVFKGVFCL